MRGREAAKNLNENAPGPEDLIECRASMSTVS